MKTNNSHLDQKPTDSTEDLKDKREAKIGLFLFITISLLFSCFFYILEAGALFSLIVPFMIGWVISTTFFGIGLGKVLGLFFAYFEMLVIIGFILSILIGGLVLLYHISTGTSIGD